LEEEALEEKKIFIISMNASEQKKFVLLVKELSRVYFLLQKHWK
jgi:hypothetical protein